MDESRQPLSRKIPYPSALINPYRLVIVVRLFVLGLFLSWRITDARGECLVVVVLLRRSARSGSRCPGSWINSPSGCPCGARPTWTASPALTSAE